MTHNSLAAVVTLRASPLRGSVQIAAQFVERARSFGQTRHLNKKGHPLGVAFFV
jgi:hypothetical protein